MYNSNQSSATISRVCSKPRAVSLAVSFIALLARTVLAWLVWCLVMPSLFPHGDRSWTEPGLMMFALAALLPRLLVSIIFKE